jgi:metallo-beta-lactamase family protein
MKLQFLGATGTVTGSKYLVEHGGHRILVDCGLFQGLKRLRLRNWEPLAIDPATIDAVVLTHAHIDHSGYLPRLVGEGFRGRVFCTPATRALCALLLPDSGHLQEDEARFANKHGFSKHAPALPLYTQADAHRALEHIEARDFGVSFEAAPGIHVHFNPAGHILGAASALVRTEVGSILFSGDLGGSDDLVMRHPAPPEPADCVLIESTYGNRLHETSDPLTTLADVVSRTAARGGVVVVPSFAVGRAQLLLHAIRKLKDAHRIPDLPVYLNSPMATDVTTLFRAHPELHRLSPEECSAMAAGVRFVTTEAESRALNDLRFPSIIVSASGMATGGRVVHHIAAFAPDPRNAIVFAGYQAAGTRGAAMLAGAREVRIHGEWVRVRAEVVSLEGLSAHADRDELLAWLMALPRPARHVFVTHGEPEAADSLRQAIEEKLHMRASVPEYLESVDIEALPEPAVSERPARRGAVEPT